MRFPEPDCMGPESINKRCGCRLALSTQTATSMPGNLPRRTPAARSQARECYQEQQAICQRGTQLARLHVIKYDIQQTNPSSAQSQLPLKWHAHDQFQSNSPARFLNFANTWACLLPCKSGLYQSGLAVFAFLTEPAAVMTVPWNRKWL